MVADRAQLEKPSRRTNTEGMPAQLLHSGVLRARWLWAAGWLALFLGHLPGLVAAVAALVDHPHPVEFVRFGLLAATQAFFVLKLADVRWLHLPNRPDVWLRFALIVALLHGGVVAHAVGADVNAPVAAIGCWAATLPAGLIGSAWFRRIASRAAGAARCIAPAGPKFPPNSSATLLLLRALQRIVILAAPLRAPPLPA